MPAGQTLIAFALVSAAIMAMPGPANLFLLGHGIAHGRRAALGAVSGMETASAIRAFRRQHQQETTTPAPRGVPAGRSARNGLTVGLANPKTMTFFIAFFPQFIHPGHGSETRQVLIPGGIYWSIGAAWDLALASASGTAGNWLRRWPRTRAARPRVEGSPTWDWRPGPASQAARSRTNANFHAASGNA